jgi:hypothetical protein
MKPSVAAMLMLPRTPAVDIHYCEYLFSADAWKSISAAGAIWIVLGFVFYAVRIWIFSLFELIPSSKFGRILLFRRTRPTSASPV